MFEDKVDIAAANTAAYLAGAEYLKAGDLENAAKFAPDDADIYVMCGDIYMAQGKKREAYVAYEKAVELGIPRPQLQDKLKASKK